MISIALKMLTGNRSKYLGIVLALAFTAFLTTQLPSVLMGILQRTYSFITDVGTGDIWVMDPKVQYVDDVKPMRDTELYRVRGLPGVEWAVPIFKGNIRAQLPDGTFQDCILVGLDDATLLGGPANMTQGSVADLRHADGIIVDYDGSRTKLAKVVPGRSKQFTPLATGDLLELNDHRAAVVGIAKIGFNFNSLPVIYTTYTRAQSYVPAERKLLSFIIVKVKPGYSSQQVIRQIEAGTELAAYPTADFQQNSMTWFIKKTGIMINFSIIVVIACLGGGAVAGQTFFTFTLDNLRYFGVMKAMGTSAWQLVGMVLIQALTAGSVGYGLGMIGVAISSYFMTGSKVAYHLAWQTPVASCIEILLICSFAALMSLRSVIRLEPAVVFKA
jgi:putative ABC transport system permease protein